MWIPKSEDEIARAIADGTLSETATFDTKRQLPGGGKTKDLAIDVCAMTAEGGVLLYGIDEDENGRPTELTPIPLNSARERVDQIVRSGVSEPPEIHVTSLPSKDDPGVGYLVVFVPPSPRAPHMVTVGKDHRYYGRSATGNVILTEAQVARLYERRQRWDIDRDALLADEVVRAPVEPMPGLAYLHMIARPVVQDEDMIARLSDGNSTADTLSAILKSVSAPNISIGNYSPDFNTMRTWVQTSEGYVAYLGDNGLGNLERKPKQMLDLQVDFDGTVHLFCGRAAEKYEDSFVIFEILIAGLANRFGKFLGELYSRAKHLGPVDIGLALTGVRGGISYHLSRQMFASPIAFQANEYRRTARVSALSLLDSPQDVAKQLVMRFITTITSGSFDPFAPGRRP